jgi:hypothetical protein
MRLHSQTNLCTFVSSWLIHSRPDFASPLLTEVPIPDLTNLICDRSSSPFVLAHRAARALMDAVNNRCHYGIDASSRQKESNHDRLRWFVAMDASNGSGNFTALFPINLRCISD